MAGILEAFFERDEISFNDLNESLLNYSPSEFLWDIPVNFINLTIIKMIRLGFIVPIETENIYSPNFKITELGVSALQQQIFQNLASSTFYNYQTHLLNRKTIRIEILMLIITFLSVIATLLSIFCS